MLCGRGRSRDHDFATIRRIILFNAVLTLTAVVAFLPTLITRQIIFGNPFGMGLYTEWHWNWDRPALLAILFSHNRGIVLWTPILIPAIAGLFLLRRRERMVGGILLAIAGGYYALIATYPWWDGISSFGNRYFITLTPLYIVGLAAVFAAFARYWGDQRAAFRRMAALTALLVVWNLGLVFQWSTGLLPERGPCIGMKLSTISSAWCPGNRFARCTDDLSEIRLVVEIRTPRSYLTGKFSNTAK